MAYGEGVFIWNFSLTGAKTTGLLGISKVRKRGLQTASLCYQHTLSSRRTQAFYQTGDAWQLCGAEKMIAFLAADTAAFKKAQQPIRHVIQGHKGATESYPSPLPQPQLIRNFGIFSKTEGNPHTLLVPCTGAATLENMVTVPQKVNIAIT